MGKGEIARNEKFLRFPQCFLRNQINEYPFVHIFDIMSLHAIELEDPKIGRSGKGIITKQQYIRMDQIEGIYRQVIQ